MKKRSKPTPDYSKLIMIILIILCAAAISLIGIACIHQYISQKSDDADDALSPGELVDKAMAIPGAIVLSPHRDLVEMGLITVENGYQGTRAYFCSPTIAVHTKTKWCVWELGGMSCALRFESDGHQYKTNVQGHNIGGSTSYVGYQSAFDSFTHCIAEGNAR